MLAGSLEESLGEVFKLSIMPDKSLKDLSFGKSNLLESTFQSLQTKSNFKSESSKDGFYVGEIESSFSSNLIFMPSLFIKSSQK